MKYWLCGEFFASSGRLSRPWVVEQDARPDAESPCEGAGKCSTIGGGDWQHQMSHVPYPFNGMGGVVISGPHASEKEAWDELEKLYPEE